MQHATSISALLQRGPRTAEEIAQHLRVSQSTASRALTQMPDVIRMGRARATKYGLLAALVNLPPQQHAVFRVDAGGELKAIGRISAITGADFWYEDLGAPGRSRAFPSLPWFLQDLRPQGFLGRATMRDFAPRGWPANLDQWSKRHVLAALVQSNAHDHIGNLLIGERSAESFLRARRDPFRPAVPFDRDLRLQRYRHFVESLGTHTTGGTSVNGEQPKFTAEVEMAGSLNTRAVLVKFTAPVTTEAGQRWSDLLCMEARSLEVIEGQLGLRAAHASWMTYGERAYLEVDRFDRLRDGGRLGVISLSSLDAEYVGLGQGWSAVAERLVEEGQLANGEQHVLEQLELFAELIGNTDRHLGNASVHFEGRRPMSLTPVYDFLPMRYAPTAIGTFSGELPFSSELIASHPAVADPDRRRAVSAALGFWQACAADERISQGMRLISDRNAQALRALTA